MFEYRIHVLLMWIPYLNTRHKKVYYSFLILITQFPHFSMVLTIASDFPFLNAIKWGYPDIVNSILCPFTMFRQSNAVDVG